MVMYLQSASALHSLLILLYSFCWFFFGFVLGFWFGLFEGGGRGWGVVCLFCLLVLFLDFLLFLIFTLCSQAWIVF